MCNDLIEEKSRGMRRRRFSQDGGRWLENWRRSVGDGGGE